MNKLTETETGFAIGQAISEANRCLLCFDPPCSKGCPAGTDPGKFIKKLKLKNITGAIRTIKNNNMLGGACGILCPSKNLCEKECSATDIDRPIRIGKIQRFLVEYGYDIDFKVHEKPSQNSQKIAVIGSGPAGLSCAAELAKKGFQATIFESRQEPGGVLRYAIPEYRYSTALLNKEIQDIKKLGVEIKCSQPVTGRGAAENLLKEGFSAVFITPGLSRSKRLKEYPGKKGILTALDFLGALREKKAAAMARYVKDKTVAVLGGGYVAIDCVESALKLGAKDVYLIYRRSFKQMPVQPDEKQAAQEAGAHFLFLNQPVDYVFDSQGKLTKIKLIRTRLGDPDASGRRKPEAIPGSEWFFDADTTIEAIGQKAAEDSTQWYPSLKVDKDNLIVVNQETCATSKEGIFAGGDIARGPALVVEAVRDGKAAAKAITEYLMKREVKK